jgi:hypothetical protein
VLDDLRQLPSEIYRILHADVEALATDRRMNMRRIAGQQHAFVAVVCRLPHHVGESRNPDRIVNAVIGPVSGDQRFAEIVQRRFLGAADFLLGHEHTHQIAIAKLAQRMDAPGVVAQAPFRLLREFDFGDQVAGGRIRSSEFDSG